MPFHFVRNIAFRGPRHMRIGRRHVARDQRHHDNTCLKTRKPQGQLWKIQKRSDHEPHDAAVSLRNRPDRALPVAEGFGVDEENIVESIAYCRDIQGKEGDDYCDGDAYCFTESAKKYSA